MSYYVDLYCGKCNEKAYLNINRQTQLVLDIIAFRTELSALFPLLGHELLDDAGRIREVISFFKEHEGHELVCMSEYGDVTTADGVEHPSRQRAEWDKKT